MTATQPAGRRNRHRALAELEAEIGRAEATRARCLLDAEDAAASGACERRTRAMLAIAEGRLGLLCGSRSVLTPDAPPPGRV